MARQKMPGPVPPGGPVPANSLSGDLGNAVDAVSAVQPQSVGKLVLATSTDPNASDYGVPPVVNVAATPFAGGQAGTLGDTATSGAFYDGGHHGSSGVGLGPAPYADLDPAWDGDEMHQLPAAQEPARPAAPKLGRQRAAAQESQGTSIAPQWHQVRDSAIDHAAGVMESCGCASCAALAQAIRGAMATGSAPAARMASRNAVAEEQRAFQRQVAGAFEHLSGVLAALTERVEAIAAQPVAGGPVAMATRGFTQLPVEQQIATLQHFAARSGDPNVQAEAAAAILSLQQG